MRPFKVGDTVSVYMDGNHRAIGKLAHIYRDGRPYNHVVSSAEMGACDLHCKPSEIHRVYKFKAGDRVRVTSGIDKGRVGVLDRGGEIYDWIIGTSSGEFPVDEAELEAAPRALKLRSGDKCVINKGADKGAHVDVVCRAEKSDWYTTDARGCVFFVNETDLDKLPENAAPIPRERAIVKHAPTPAPFDPPATTTDPHAIPSGFFAPLEAEIKDEFYERTITVRMVRRTILAAGVPLFRGEVKQVCAGPSKLVAMHVRTL